MSGRSILMCAGIVLVAAAPGGSDQAVGDYDLRLPVTPAPGGGVQRITLPARVLAALRTSDGRDVRVFDGRGRVVPMARAPVQPAVRQDALDPLPILAASSSATGARISIRLDRDGRARIADVQGAAAGSERAIAQGVLLDARRVRAAATQLIVEADLPAGQPVTVAVDASGNLRDWRFLGERVLYRRPGAAAHGEPIALRSAALDGDYLRITWRGEARLLSPVTIRRAVLISRDDASAAEVVVAAKSPPLAEPHAVTFAYPLAIAPASLRVTPAAGDMLAPVRVLGRADREQPWRLLGKGTAARDGRPIVLQATPVRTMRIEADERTAGFSAPPALSFGFAPRTIAFVAAGAEPFTLAAGRAGAADAFLPIEALGADREGALPDAGVGGSLAAALVLAPDETPGGWSRQATLWAILLGATALLGGLAWLLWRRDRTNDPG